MYKRRNMKGGNANVRPIEYYGGNSGNYHETVPPTAGSAYGQIHPVSHGVIRGGVAGPNLAVYPNGGSIQTGGAKRRRQKAGCACGARKSRSRSRTKRASGRTRRTKRAKSRTRRSQRRSSRR